MNARPEGMQDIAKTVGTLDDLLTVTEVDHEFQSLDVAMERLLGILESIANSSGIELQVRIGHQSRFQCNWSELGQLILSHAQSLLMQWNKSGCRAGWLSVVTEEHHDSVDLLLALKPGPVNSTKTLPVKGDTASYMPTGTGFASGQQQDGRKTYGREYPPARKEIPGIGDFGGSYLFSLKMESQAGQLKGFRS